MTGLTKRIVADLQATAVNDLTSLNAVDELFA
ncbi:acyl carrier protein S-malonyltransferase [Pasteurella multocida subsp. multocida str. Anand1_cattle]|nr:acyl carrier protein S-malonyltransferase [Pasteurella multocida subsp. multocida str. Anand1_cattle]